MSWQPGDRRSLKRIDELERQISVRYGSVIFHIDDVSYVSRVQSVKKTSRAAAEKENSNWWRLCVAWSLLLFSTAALNALQTDRDWTGAHN